MAADLVALRSDVSQQIHALKRIGHASAIKPTRRRSLLIAHYAHSIETGSVIWVETRT